MSEDKDAPVVEETPEVQADAEKPEAAVDEAQAQEPSDSSPEKKEPKGVQKRIDELTRNWRETERDRDYWRELAVREQRPQEPPKAPEPPGKTLEDFEYDESKYHAYLTAQAREEAKAEAARVIQEEYQRETRARRQSTFAAKESDFAKATEDYHEVTRNPSLSLTQEMYDIAADSDKGPEILYYLGKNPSISDQLSRLPPLRVAMEIGRIEAKLASAPKGSSVSKAPPPTPKIEAVAPSLDVKASSPESDALTTEEWATKRNKELANRS